MSLARQSFSNLTSTRASQLTHTTIGGTHCFKILNHALNLANDEAAASDTCSSDAILPVDPIVRVASTFLSQLLCHTAIVPACDAQLAQSLGGSSEMRALPTRSYSNFLVEQSSEEGDSCSKRWRLWALQREAVVLLLKCMRSPLYPHVASTAVFIISGALQASTISNPCPNIFSCSYRVPKRCSFLPPPVDSFPIHHHVFI
jgi:hypothetical protein